jgi:uncharacterized protein
MTEPKTPIAEPKAPVLEFPCAYPLKIMGQASPVFTEQVLAVCSQEAPGFDRELVRILPSSKGRFVSVHVVIQAQGPEHIERLYQALKALPDLKMVL